MHKFQDSETHSFPSIIIGDLGLGTLWTIGMRGGGWVGVGWGVSNAMLGKPLRDGVKHNNLYYIQYRLFQAHGYHLKLN